MRRAERYCYVRDVSPGRDAAVTLSWTQGAGSVRLLSGWTLGYALGRPVVWLMLGLDKRFPLALLVVLRLKPRPRCMRFCLSIGDRSVQAELGKIWRYVGRPMSNEAVSRPLTEKFPDTVLMFRPISLAKRCRGRSREKEIVKASVGFPAAFNRPTRHQVINGSSGDGD